MATIREVRIPNLGDFDAVQLIEVAVAEGDRVNEGDTLVTLESEKATMEVPSPCAGIVTELSVRPGQTVSEGTLILSLRVDKADAPLEARTHASSGEPSADRAAAEEATRAVEEPESVRGASAPPVPPEGIRGAGIHAGPAVRRFARELGVDLGRVRGSGPKGRILQEDVLAYVRRTLARPGETGAPESEAPETGLHVAPWPAIDFGKYGPTESRPLSRVRRIAGANLHRNWVMIPHVTNHEEADITELEAYRLRINAARETDGPKVTLLAFLIEAAAKALAAFPDFNASLEHGNLILKRYCHIGFAVDTAEGLVVPVIRDADRKGLLEIAREASELAARAREANLAPPDLQGGCFTISSLGGIGGSYFTPIIRAPEVAILGVSRATVRPVWDGTAFVPRRILPLSLSWDHRVLDGAAAARFCSFFARLLAERAPRDA